MTTTTESPVSAALDMAAYYLLDAMDHDQPDTQNLHRSFDCGTVRVRIRVEVEPTGRTPEQALAEVVASDPAESPEARAAARVVLAGGPGLEAAREVLARPV